MKTIELIVVILILITGFSYNRYQCNKLNNTKQLGIATIKQSDVDNNGAYFAVYDYTTKEGVVFKERNAMPTRKLKLEQYYLIYNEDESSLLLIDFPVSEEKIPSLDSIKVDCFCNVSYLK